MTSKIDMGRGGGEALAGGTIVEDFFAAYLSLALYTQENRVSPCSAAEGTIEAHAWDSTIFLCCFQKAFLFV